MRFVPAALSVMLPALLIATPASAQLRPLVDSPATAEQARDGVTIFLINDSAEAKPLTAPATIDAIARDGSPIHLVRGDESDDPASVPAGGFAKLLYRLGGAGPAPARTATATIAGAEAAPAATTIAAAETAAPHEQVVTGAGGTGSGFFDRFRPHEPIYGVFGADDAGAKLQFSLGLVPFAGNGFLSKLNVAYTQTIFWAVDRPSGPVRATTYSPEVYFDIPVTPTLRIAPGYRHDSDGLGGAASIDVNRFSLRANKTISLGNGWRIDVSPQAWFYVGAQGAAPNLDRFWGYTSLTASIAQQDGVKFQIFARGNPSTGKGAAEFFLSYPIRRLGLGDIGIYAFAQAWTGYGETLLDYNRSDTHARLGIAFTR